jgi:YD repeat-containing protein
MPNTASAVVMPRGVDISRYNWVNDFGAAYACGIRGVIHKASEGDYKTDRVCAAPRPRAEKPHRGATKLVYDDDGNLIAHKLHDGLTEWVPADVLCARQDPLYSCGLNQMNIYGGPLRLAIWATTTC